MNASNESKCLKVDGPDYLNESVCQAMIGKLLERGCVLSSSVATTCRAYNVWMKTMRIYGIEEIDQVDETLIRMLYRYYLQTGKTARMAREYVRLLGTMVMCSTGRNPYSANLVQEKRRDPDAILERFISGCRFAEDLRRYKVDMRQRCLKQNTIYDNITSIVRTVDFADGILGDRYGIEDIDLDFLSTVRMAMTDVSERTCKRYIEIMRRFCRFVTGKDPLRANLMWNDSHDFAPNRRFISLEQWKSMDSDANPMEHLILCLGATMGLRCAEIARIKLTDIEDGKLTIRGKGHGPEGKVVVVGITSAVSRAISDYLPVRGSIIECFGDNSEGSLLIQQWKDRGCPLNPWNVNDIVKRLGRRHGVVLTSHSLRRLFATTLYDSGVDQDTLRRMMRHSNIQTTMQCYLEADPRRMKDASDRIDDAFLS